MDTDVYLGCICMFAGSFAPRGFHVCDGSLIPISQNTALFSIIGTFYGGNGTSNFALPDLRSRVPVGAGTGAGLSQLVIGEATGATAATLLTANLPAHSHTATCDNAGATTGNPVGTFPGHNTNLAPAEAYYETTANGAMNAAAVVPTGNSAPLSVQNPVLGIYYVIATQGVFPARN